MKLTIVGCTGSFPGPESPASCYLLTADDADGRTWRILLDLGSGALGYLQRHIDLTQIDAVLLTHLHADHCLDMCGLHVAMKWCPEGWPGGRIPVYCPETTNTRMALAYGLDPDPGMTGEFDFTDWREEQPVRIGPFTATPYAANHPTDQAYALRVETTEGTGDGGTRTSVLTYSGDTDSCPGLVKAAAGADIFLCEAAFHEGRDEVRDVHLTGKRAGEAAAEAGAAKLLLTHLPVWNDPQRALAEARGVFSGELDVVAPGASYVI